MPKRFSLTATSKRMICSRCCVGIKLPAERYCEDCAIDIQLRKEHPEHTSAGNWLLRTRKSREASYKAKRQKQLFERLCKLKFRIDFLYAQKKIMPEDSNILNMNISKLLDKHRKTSQTYEALLNEPEAVAVLNKQLPKKRTGSNREIVTDYLQALLTCTRKMAADELRSSTQTP
jgi:hypothetical protein